MKTLTTIILLSAVAMLALAGCGKKKSASAPQAMAVPVVAAEAKRQPVTEKLSLVGTLVATESIEVKAEIDGLVKTVHFEDGQKVKKGDVLVELDDRKLKAAFAEAAAQFALGESSLKRTKELFESKLISAQEFDPVNSTFPDQSGKSRFEKRAAPRRADCCPFDGTMGIRQVSPGQAIAKTTVISTLVNLNPIKVEVNVPERFLSELQPGQNLDFTVATFPKEKFTGELYFIASRIDANLRMSRSGHASPTRMDDSSPACSSMSISF